MNETIIKHSTLIKVKISLLIIIQWSLLICWSIISAFSWNDEWRNITLHLIPEDIQILRCVNLFVIAWYIFISLIIWNILDEYKIDNKDKLLSLFSFLFVPSIFLSIKYFKYLSFLNIIDLLKNEFGNSSNAQQIIKRKSFVYILSCVLFGIYIIVIPALAFYVSPNNGLKIYLPNNSEHIIWTDLWFNSLQFFTIQSNFLCLFVLLIFVINPNAHFFKNRILLIIATINIIVVCLVYNCILLPNYIITKKINNWDLQNWLSLAFNHIFNPISFVIFFIILNTKYKHKIEIKFKNYFISTLLLPTIYLIYAICQPFVSYTSVYGFATNLNPNVLTDLNTPGNSINIIYIVLIYLIFCCLSLVFYFINNKLMIRRSKDEK